MILKCCGSGSSGNSYALITDSGEILLIECGLPWYKKNGDCIERMIDFKPSKVVGCLVSHGHHDHLGTIQNPFDFIRLLENGIQIYTNDKLVYETEIKYGEKLIGKPERFPFFLGEYRIVPFYVPHDGCPNFAYLISHPESGYILYATDMSRIAKVGSEYRMKKENGKPVDWSFKNLRLSHMVLECNYDFSDFADIDEFKKSHVGFGHHSLQACKRFVEQNKTPDLRTVTLVHLSRDADEENILRQVKEVAGSRVEVNVAVPRLCLELKKLPF